MTVLTPEQEARRRVDGLLEAAGWSVQSRERANPDASGGVAVADFPRDTGFADYVLFMDRRLIGVEAQTARFSDGLPRLPQTRAWCDPLPFLYQSTGIETFFTNEQDPNPRSRRVFAFHQPETLAEWARPAGAVPPRPPWASPRKAHPATSRRRRCAPGFARCRR